MRAPAFVPPWIASLPRRGLARSYASEDREVAFYGDGPGGGCAVTLEVRDPATRRACLHPAGRARFRVEVSGDTGHRRAAAELYLGDDGGCAARTYLAARRLAQDDLGAFLGKEVVRGLPEVAKRMDVPGRLARRVAAAEARHGGPCCAAMGFDRCQVWGQPPAVLAAFYVGALDDLDLGPLFEAAIDADERVLVVGRCA